LIPRYSGDIVLAKRKLGYGNNSKNDENFSLKWAICSQAIHNIIQRVMDRAVHRLDGDGSEKIRLSSMMA